MKASRRNKLKKSQFGLPGARKFPIDTKARAINAKGRATQAVKAGRMKPSTAAKIHARANKVIKRKG